MKKEKSGRFPYSYSYLRLIPYATILLGERKKNSNKLSKLYRNKPARTTSLYHVSAASCKTGIAMGVSAKVLEAGKVNGLKKMH